MGFLDKLRSGGDLTVGVTLDPPEPAPGGVALSEEAKVTAVRIRLHRRCTYVAPIEDEPGALGGSVSATLVFSGNDGKIVKDEQVAEVDLAGKRSFAAGETEELEFSITVPDAGPTTAHQFARVEWRLEAVLDRRLRGDLAVETPLVVL